MSAETLQAAIREAERFLERAKDLRKSYAVTPFATGTKLSGSVRRASLDLTRALADLRRYR